MPSNEYLLVRTACIDPGAGHYRIDRADPDLRLSDYQHALRFWLAYPDPRTRRILFIENSGYPLDSLEAIAAAENPLHKEAEFISLHCNWYPETSHYGYAEMRMLDLGLQQSQLRRDTTHMIKVTGRLTFPVLSRLLDHIPAGFDFVADARIWKTPWQKHGVPFVATQLILFSHDFYAAHLQTQYDEMAGAYRRGHQRPLLETFFYRKLSQLPSDPKHPACSASRAASIPSASLRTASAPTRIPCSASPTCSAPQCVASPPAGGYELWFTSAALGSRCDTMRSALLL